MCKNRCFRLSPKQEKICFLSFFFCTFIRKTISVWVYAVFGHISFGSIFSPMPNSINHRCAMAMTHDIEEEKKQNSCSATVLKPREGQGLWIINRRHRNYTEGAWNVKKFRKNEHELRLSKGFATGKYDEEIKFNAAIFYRIPLKYPLDEKKKCPVSSRF